MLEILVATILCSFFLITSGNLFCKFVFPTNYYKELSIAETTLLGIIILSFLALIINLLFPLDIYVCSILFIFIFIYGILNKTYKNTKIIIISSIIAFILILNSNINRPDAGLYHLPIVSMINENRIILGSSNIHFRFAHGSIIQYFSALFNIPFIDKSFITIPAASIFAFYIYYLYQKLVEAFAQNNNFSFILIFIFFVFSIYLFNRYSNYGNDAVAHIYYFYFILSIFFLLNKDRINELDLSKLILTSVFLVGTKLFMVISAIPAIYFFLLFKNKIILFKNKLIYLSAIFFLILLLKSFLTSGCALYPIKITCLKSLKIHNSIETGNIADMSEAWSKGWPDQKIKVKNYKNFNSNFNWLETWKANHLKYIIEKVSPFFVFLIIITLLLFFYSNKNFEKHKKEEIKGLYRIIFFILFCSIIWFVKFPLYRFGTSYIFCLMTFLFLVILKNRILNINIKYISKYVVFFMILSSVGFFGKNIIRILDKNNFEENTYWPKIYPNKEFKKLKISDNGFIYFSEGEQCMYSPSPCSYYKNEKLNYIKKFGYKIFWVE